MKEICFILAVVMVMLSVFSCARAAPERSSVYSGRHAVIENGEDGFSVYTSSLSGKLCIYNTEFNSFSVVLYSDNGRSVSLDNTYANRMKEADGIGGTLCAAVIEVDGVRKAYALTCAGLDALLASAEAEIIIPRHLDYEGDIIIPRPVKLSGSLSAGNIYCISDKEGELTFEGDISCSLFASSAPMIHITVPDSIVPENTDLYICAASLNGVEASPDKRIADNLKELDILLSRPVYYIPEAETIVLSEMEIDEKVTVDFPCSIDASTAVFSEKLYFKTESFGTITVTGEVDQNDIEVDAPKCDLVLDNPCRLDIAAEYYNIRALNGYELSAYTLGGQCSDRILSAHLSSDGQLMTDSVRWSVEGNVLSATVDGVAAPSRLKNANVVFETLNGGKVTVEDVSKGQEDTVDLLCPLGTYVIVTDSEGNSSRYRLDIAVLSQLPVVVIETETGKNVETRFEYIKGTMAVESDYTRLPSFEKTDIEIKGRGNSTWSWSEKTPYKVKYDRDVSLLGLESGKEWVLLANYNDKSLIRNYVALEAAKVLDNMDCYASQYPVDVFVCGEYMGVYTLGEQIEVGDGRVSIHSDATDVDTGYFLEVGGKAEFDGENTFSTEYMDCVEILEPSEGALTDKNKTYIVNYMKMADDAVRNLKGYEDYIDVDSLIDWYILTELSFNSDGAMRRSVFLIKDHGGKLRMGPVWDYDLAFGNNGCDYNNYSSWCCLATDYGYVAENWMCRLMEDEAFIERLRERWNEVKVPLRENILASIELASSAVAHSAAENFTRWDILSSAVGMQPAFMAEYDTYESQVQYLSEFVLERMNWIDSQLN
ncbi:MAG: CotH kinase family protein [Clostridia bacterium]|nr:CotH kinase family protein [Clostridia bacterium]